ncbi:MAG TPA: universal stress protein [Gaiellaceae bacterium]|jgi:nucleotide-binding universal stress UspA family protein|nr:universal stress protein [Gaiellaceae bacterium]
MGGTILCGVTDSREGQAAAQLAGALSERLGSRLVLAHAVDGVPPGTHESLTARQRQAGAERALEELARGLGTNGEIELRVGFGDRAELLAQIAAEEGADLIVLGSRASGLRGRQLACTLARELEASTPAPVLVAPPQTRRRAERRLAVAEAASTR